MTGSPLQQEITRLAEDYAGEAFVAQPTCPICAGASTILHQAVNIHPENPVELDVRVCSVCGHGWIDPMPTQGLLSHLYSKGSRSVIGVWGESSMTIPEKMCLDRESSRRPGKYFELGVGQGHLYRKFIERGWDCTGVDPGDWSSSIPNVHRDLNDVPVELNADLLVAFDVLEHVTDPIAILRGLRKLGAAGATLYCAMPNRESMRAKRHGKNWRMMRPLGHVNYYSRDSITRALKSAGFAVTFIRATDLYKVSFPRNLLQLKMTAVELLGMGDQLVVAARAI